MNGNFSFCVHALVYLDHMKRPLTSEELAKNICVNPVRVRLVMSLLKRAGIVSAKEGSDGGYTLERDADTLTLEQVAQAAGVRFVDASWRSGSADMDCMVASGMAGEMDSLYRKLDGVCRDYLKNITVADMERGLFKKGRA